MWCLMSRDSLEVLAVDNVGSEVATSIRIFFPVELSALIFGGLVYQPLCFKSNELGKTKVTGRDRTSLCLSFL